MKSWRGWLGFVALIACGDGGTNAESESNRRGGLGDLCSGTPTTTALGWEEASSLGVSPREAFGGLAGSCQADFSWSAAGLSSVALAPAAGDTRIKVMVAVDEGSARLLEPAQAYCGTALQVDADVRFESEDGVFADGGRVTLSYYGKSGSPMISLTRKSSELEGSLRATLKENQTLSVQYRSSGADAACAGELMLTVNETHGNMGSGSAGVAGSWSNSGCKLGEAAVALDGSSALGEAIKSEMAQHWSEVSFTGRWEQGQETTLTLAAKLAGERGCEETSGVDMVTLPIQLTYATGDGRIVSHAADAHMNFFRAGEGLRQAQLIMSETLTCARGGAQFPYLDLSCGKFARAEVQILVNRYLDRSPSDEMRLELYEYAADNVTSAADAYERLASTAR